MTIITRVWEMPNKNTFDIRSIRQLIYKYHDTKMLSIDPFANKSQIASFTNDLSDEFNTEYHLDAMDFLNLFKDREVDFVFYDPPYSPRQVSECYNQVGRSVTMKDTQSTWRSSHLDKISSIIKPGGILMSFGWNSNGAGINRGFQMIEILLVAHGGSHNDTICVVERKHEVYQTTLL